jgi:hypothetical protein
MKSLLAVLGVLVVLAIATVYRIGAGGPGTNRGAGTPTPLALQARIIAIPTQQQHVA